MSMSDRRTMLQTAEDVRSRRKSARSVVDECLSQIDRSNASLNAFREVYRDRAREEAARIDANVAKGEVPGALAGVPIALKDNIVTDFGTTTCGSRFLERYSSPFSATVVRRLQQAGAIIIGQTNCDEFAMGS